MTDIISGKQNPYMEASAIRLGFIAFLSGLFFPWYLLYRLYSRGWEDTLFLVRALVHDWLSGIIYLFIALAALALGFFIFIIWGIASLF